MTTPVEKIFAERKFPKWFSNHPIFKEIKTVKKVFPGIGLPNFEYEMKIENCDTTKNIAVSLINDIKHTLTERSDTLREFIKTSKKIGAERIAAGNKYITLLSLVAGSLSENDTIKDNKGKLALKLSKNITIDGERVPTFRDGESIFRVYNKLNDLLHSCKFAAMNRLEDIQSFKSFSSENIPNNNNFKIVFSSDGVDGAWDIGTMSSRGIRSCQSWDDGEYKHCTIGSVIDPFVGIIYLTSGNKFNSYGSKMIRRCIVRFAVNETTNKPFILIDNMYPELDTKVLNQFKKALTEKTNNKFEVHYANAANNRDVLSKSYIPMNDIRKKLSKSTRDDRDCYTEDLDEYDTIQSYQDFKIKSKTSNVKDKDALLFEKNSKKKSNLFVEQFSKSFTKSVKNIDIAVFSDSIKPAIRKLKGIDKNTYNYTYLLPEIGSDIAKTFIKSINVEDFNSSNLYFKKIYFNYFVNKNKIFDELKTKIIRELNGKLSLKGNNRLRSAHFISIMKLISTELNTELKMYFKDFLTNGKVNYKFSP